MLKKMAAMLVVALAAVIAAPVQAFEIAVDGNVLLRDDAELGTVTTPVVPNIGSYNDDSRFTVRAGTDGGDGIVVVPGPFQGQQYLGLVNSGATITNTFSLGGITSGTVKIQTAVYTVGLSNDFALRFEYGDSTSLAITPTGLQIKTQGGTAEEFHSEFMVADQWDELTVEHTVGSGAMTITINGVSETFSNFSAGSGGLSFVQLYNADSNRYSYFDLIPEPGTFSLLALGGLAMLRRRRA